ncbi:MAG: lysophospholipid acyltransferase family protein [Luteibacter sp.]|jgi:putative hemolysin|uniref:lysophospholipid acyltransferase family protein n=1 Tax=Rhodanobacteraceae TaxID=1775411 RepID=UPI0005BE8A24|nr:MULTISPECIES: lysophospholipid acyltransferase family protein [Rhodanobacteraceae]MDQ7998210.1 lysophospholipid acyltransferase family protein [Luteibacter sp.]MDQ8051086.1 lysophospholipid acyltransferase family protein [Luteibacter sp.]SDG76529.1 Putative hemolysin [Dyella sp. 333MFSha]
MLSIDQTLQERLPWLAQHPLIRKPLVGMLEKLAHETRFNKTLDHAGAALGFDFCERTLDYLGVSCRITERERENIPVEGPLIVVANHPLGMVDAIALLQMIGSVRRDVRILGNDVLAAVPQLGPLLLPVDVFGKGSASRMRNVFRAIQAGEVLVMFPAGEVSRVGPSGVRDGKWSDGFARIAMKSGVPVLPVHIAARNSVAFYGLSMLAKPLSTAMLPREATSGHQRVTFRIGKLVDADELKQVSGGSAEQAAKLMRRHVYRVGRGRDLVFGGQTPLAHPEPVERVAAELDKAELLAELADGKRILLMQGSSDSYALREIGRLRELTFRRVGEGTGKRRDLDAYDPYYEHLVLWDAKALRIVGAYRFGHGGRLIAERGMTSLYTSSLFDYSPALESRLAQGLELGRSFIAPAYWRSRALDQLWQGIGLYLQRHADVRYLFGPVSMSVSMPREAREWIAAAHQHFFGVQGLAAARQPFVIPQSTIESVRAELEGLDPASGLGRLKHRLDALGVTLPVLYRQYVDLVEPTGVQFLAFGEDPDFAGCVDGLVMLDLASLKPAKRSRYLGKG